MNMASLTLGMGIFEAAGDILAPAPIHTQTIHRRFRRFMTALSEQSELDGLRELNPQVIGSIYDKYFPEVYRYVRYRLNDEHLAEDIASDAFVRLLEASQQRRGPQTNLKAWLIGTASHIVMDHLRRAYRRPTQELSENQLDPLALPADEYDNREQQASVRAAMKSLTEEQQQVLALRFGQGYSLEETAAVMKKNVNAIKALQFRALSALQRGIGEASHD
jgi:RNA polymerase sigma-70 factor (ECF subfamily)